MLEVAYGIGVDIGTTTVVAAVCPADVDAAPEAAFHRELPAVLAAWADGRPLSGTGPGRLQPPRDLLHRVGDPAPLQVGDRHLAAAGLVAELVTGLVADITASAGRPPSWTVVAVPPSWSGHRLAALAGALRDRGLPESSPVSSAIAAVRARRAAGNAPPGGTALVVDVGADSCDVAVVADRTDAEPVHLAVPPAPLAWGGRDVDDAVLRHVRHSLELPGRVDAGPAGALRGAVTAAKEAASLQTEVEVAVDPAWSTTGLRLTREEIEDLVADDVERLADRTAAALPAAGLTPGQLDAVVLTGGSARMPLVVERLSAALGVPPSSAADPALTAALGAARLAADRGTAVPEEDATGQDGAIPGGPRDDRRRPRRSSRPAPGGRGRTRPGPTATGAGRRSAPAGRIAIVSGVFLLLMLGAPVALGLLGLYRGGAPDDGAAVADAAGAVETTQQPPHDGSGSPGAVATSNAARVQSDPGREPSSSQSHDSVVRRAGSSGTARTTASSSSAPKPAAAPASTTAATPAATTPAATTPAATTPAATTPAPDTTAPGTTNTPAAAPTDTGTAPPDTTVPPPPSSSEAPPPPATTTTATGGTSTAADPPPSTAGTTTSAAPAGTTAAAEPAA